MKRAISKIGSWWYGRKQKNYERNYEQFQDYIEEHGYKVNKKGLRNLGYICLKDGFSVEGHENILAERIADYREKKQAYRDRDFSYRELLRPKPSHVTQTWTNMAKLVGIPALAVVAGFHIGEFIGYPGVGGILGIAGFIYTMLEYAPKVTNEGNCDLCGAEIHTTQELNLEGEKRDEICRYILCDDCYDEKKDEHISFEDMRWSWRNFELVKSVDKDNTSTED